MNSAPILKLDKRKTASVRRLRTAAHSALLMHVWREALGLNRGDHVTNDRAAWGWRNAERAPK